MKQTAWMAWVEPLNNMAGLTLVVVATCQECGTVYPASPRQRVNRCPPCREIVRKRRYQKSRPGKRSLHRSPKYAADAQPEREAVEGVSK